MHKRGRPCLPANKRKENAKLVRLDDERFEILLAIADEKGIAPATLMRSYIHKCLIEEFASMNISSNISA